ncbi:calcium-binding protein [Algirhabdus cladophorae]|uniref:calcium-binding protein n=1 Tax=Algirhabdus cladophorae TaxID=3377108 RepID=UPI003B846F84
MASRNFTLNDGSVFTLFFSDSGYGFDEIAFKLANADGTDRFGQTDLRVTPSGESEVFGGATILPDGTLRVFFAAYQDFSNSDIQYQDFDGSTGAAIGGPVASPITAYIEEFDAVFPVGSNVYEQASDLLTLSDGSIAIASDDILFVIDQSGTTTGVAYGTGSRQSGSLSEVNGKLVEVTSVQNFVSGADPQEGQTFAQFFEFDTGTVTMIQGPEILLSENFHVQQTLFGLGLNSVDTAVLSDGRIVAVYSDFLYENGAYDDNRQSVFVKVINPDGTTDIAEFMASTGLSAGDTIRPEVFALYDGGFAVAFNTTMGFPQFNQTEVRVFTEAGVERDSYILEDAYNPEGLYVAPSGELWIFTDDDTQLLVNFDVDGGPAPVGIVLDGDDTDEILEGTAFDDEINGKKGDDTIDGLEGKDRLKGGLGDDTLNGGDQADILEGGAGKDVLNGGRGTDKLIGGKQADVLNGQQGTDKLLGGNGSDNLRGGSGKDKLYGEAGNDKLHGGQGADQFVFSTGDGKDKIVDFADGQDEIVILSGANSFADLTITANGGDAKVSFSNVEITLKGIDNSDLSSDDFSFGF